MGEIMTTKQLIKTGFFIGVGLATANITFQIIGIAFALIARGLQ
jgi:hypothetical protein